MTTQFSFADTLPKDSGGAKFAAWLDASTSQLDFAMPAGIGSRTTASKILAALQVGTHVGGSVVDHPVVGVLGMAHFASNASVVSTMGAVPVRGDDRGQIYTTSLSMVACAITATSHDTWTVSSGLLYRIVAATCGAIPGAQVRVLNGGASLTHISFSQNSETVTVDFGTGTCYSSLITERVNTTQPVYITTIYRGYGQG